MLAGTTPRMLSRIHGEAAEHYIAIGSEPLETLHHLVASGNMARAAEFALVEEKKLFGAGNPQDLSAAMGSILGNASAQPGLLEIAARAYDMAGRSDACTVARKIISDWPDSPECPKARILLAKMLAKKGSLDEALGSLADIQKASQEILAETHHTQASILRRLCRLEEAAGECEKAMTFSKKNTILQARCLMESALINSALGRNGDALLELDSAGALVRQCESEPDIIRCGMNRGVILRALGRNEEALEELESAVKLAGESGQNRLRAQGLANLTELLNIGGDFTRSADLASQAIGLFTALQEPIMLAVSKFNMGEALAGLGRREEAIRVGDEAVTLLVEHNLVKSRGKWIKDYAKLLDGMGERKKAAALRAKLR
jgi:tetratricopeptide (TPR) repeat protein